MKKPKGPAFSVLCTLPWVGSEPLFKYLPIIQTAVSTPESTYRSSQIQQHKHIVASKKAHYKLMTNLKKKKTLNKTADNDSHIWAFQTYCYGFKKHIFISQRVLKNSISWEVQTYCLGVGVTESVKARIFSDNHRRFA